MNTEEETEPENWLDEYAKYSTALEVQLKERDAEIAALKEALGWALSEAGPFHDDISCDLYDKYRKLL